MPNVARIPSFLIIALVLGACSPVATPVQIAPTVVEPRDQPVISLEFNSLDSSQVVADLGTLMQLQGSRTQTETDLARQWFSHPAAVLNEQARYWVSYYGMDPVVASRVYALTSVAQQRALDLLAHADNDFSIREPKLLNDQLEPIALQANPYESAVVIGATEPIFLYVFPEIPNEIKAVFEEARAALLISGNILASDLEVSENFGRTVAEDVIEERKEDGASKAREFDPLPVGEGIWKPDPFRVRPEQPSWGKVTPWLMTSGDQFRAPPPPAFGSIAYVSALEDVRVQQENNTQAQLAIAQKWADKRFTATPPGHWNLIAVDMTLNYGLSDLETVHVLSALNMAMMDAGIACWDSKYTYLVVRPWQADPNIAGLVGYPNHPSYPSGHSCFSGAGAETLAYFFPAERESLWQMAEEASISRFYAGIHFRFDMEAGKEIGRQIGGLAQLYATQQMWPAYAP